MDHGRIEAGGGQRGARRAVEEPELLGGEGPVVVVDLVGHGEMGPEGVEAQARRGVDGGHDGRPGRPASAPTRCMPVSTFTWTPSAGAGGGGRRAAAAATPSAGVERWG